MKFGISDASYQLILNELSKFPEIDAILIFGSRAMGNFHNGSDIDLALKGNLMSDELVLKISGILNEQLPIPYKIDVLNYHSIENEDLIKHIDRVGVNFRN